MEYLRITDIETNEIVADHIESTENRVFKREVLKLEKELSAYEVTECIQYNIDFTGEMKTINLENFMDEI